MQHRKRMPLLPALKTLADWRSDQIVVTTMGASREWPKLSQHPLDFHYIPSAMGHGPMLALGLALALPEREVVAFNGDGCMLMGLGGLVTIVASAAKNLSLIVLDNGIYEVTGGQATAGAQAAVDFAGVARAAGFPAVAAFDNLHEWQSHAAEVLALPGPRFICLGVEPVGAEFQLSSPAPMADRIEKFRAALANGVER
ncbi:MAG TPA: thiamine pyrophosphate-dependent enzyme [Pirellulales bacterium]|nr:thiamine pyrophosphate-dependent enzyme [Pirellulales bacterium]